MNFLVESPFLTTPNYIVAYSESRKQDLMPSRALALKSHCLIQCLQMVDYTTFDVGLWY